MLGTHPHGHTKMAVVMHVQVVTYRIADISDPDFVEANQEFAEMMAAVPGLLAKVWLKDPDKNIYGGLYLWQDRQACESFLASDLWAEVVKDDSMSNLETHDFAVMDELTRSTQPGLKLL
jgi:Putative mono-oxygenase ydhR